MLKKEKKGFAYMGIHNEQGFTFLSILLTVTILFMMLPFISYILKSVDFPSNYNELATQQFFHILRDDVIKATNYTIDQTAITLYLRDGTTATIEKYKDQIRRHVEGEGHEIYLRDIEIIHFSALPYGFHTQIIFPEGEHYEKDIVFYK